MAAIVIGGIVESQRETMGFVDLDLMGSQERTMELFFFVGAGLILLICSPYLIRFGNRARRKKFLQNTLEKDLKDYRYFFWLNIIYLIIIVSIQIIALITEDRIGAEHFQATFSFMLLPAMHLILSIIGLSIVKKQIANS